MKQWPVNKAYFWETAPFSRLLLPLIAGIVSYRLLYIDVYAAITATVICTATLICFNTANSKLTRSLRFILTHIILFLSAWTLCWFSDIKNDASWFGKDIAAAEAFAIVVSKPPTEKEKTWKLNVDVIGKITKDRFTECKGSALVYVFKSAGFFNISQGDTLIIPNKWQPIRNAGNPFEFDYSAYCARNNLYFQQFLAPQDMVIGGRASSSDNSWIDVLHEACMHQLTRYVDDGPTLGLLQAMLIGDEANLDNDLRQAYSETGIVHVIAISGSHIAFLFFIITFLLSWVKNRRYHWIKYAIALPLVWSYVLVAGAPPSAVRAAIMFSVLSIGFALQKQPNTLNQLMVAAFVLLCAQPMWLFSIGFQLSFLAVLSLVLFYKPVFTFFKTKNLVFRAIWSAAAASIAAEILVAPLVAYYFHIFPLNFIIANVAAFLFMGVVLIAGLLIIIFSALTPIAALIAEITTWMVMTFNHFVYWLQQLNPGWMLRLNVEIVELLLTYLLIALLGTGWLQRSKRAIKAGMAVVCLLIIAMVYSEWRASKQQRIVVYNINRANHIELINGGTYTIINTGTIDERQYKFSIQPAHAGWYASSPSGYDTSNLQRLGSASLLILDSMVDRVPHYDYILLNFIPKSRDFEVMKKTFTARKIVLGSHVSLLQSQKWKLLCDSLAVPLHATQLDGAFVLESL